MSRPKAHHAVHESVDAHAKLNESVATLLVRNTTEICASGDANTMIESSDA